MSAGLVRTAETVARWLQPYCVRVEIAGSIRRGKENPKDAEIVVIPELLTGNFYRFLDALVGEAGLLAPALPPEVAAYRIRKARYGEKQRVRWGLNYRGLEVNEHKIEIFTATADTWGYIFWLRTGPGDANTFIMQERIKRNWNWQAVDGEILVDGQRLAVKDEHAMFALMGMDYLPPRERTIEAYAGALGKRPKATMPAQTQKAATAAPPAYTDDEVEWGRACYRWAWESFGVGYAIPEQYFKSRVALAMAEAALAGVARFTERDAQALANNREAIRGFLQSAHGLDVHISRVHELEHKRDAYAKAAAAVRGAAMDVSRIGALMDVSTRARIDLIVKSYYALAGRKELIS